MLLSSGIGCKTGTEPEIVFLLVFFVSPLFFSGPAALFVGSLDKILLGIKSLKMATAEHCTKGDFLHHVPAFSEASLFKSLAQNSCLVWMGSKLELREDRCRLGSLCHPADYAFKSSPRDAHSESCVSWGGGVDGGRCVWELRVPGSSFSFFLPPWERGVCRKCRTESLGSDDGRWGDTT